ncbi:unnamed protein product, partial [marine sediment metagenome]
VSVHPDDGIMGSHLAPPDPADGDTSLVVVIAQVGNQHLK